MPRIRKETFYDEPVYSTKRGAREKTTAKSPAEVETMVSETIKNGTIVGALNVNVRKGPSLESEVLEVLRKGDKVRILDKDNNFYKVSTSVNPVAYIAFDFIKEE